MYHARATCGRLFRKPVVHEQLLAALHRVLKRRTRARWLIFSGSHSYAATDRIRDIDCRRD
jgi:hypothetical protein